VLEVALARFQHEQAMREELIATKSALSEMDAELHERKAELHDRKVIDRAKGLLMQRQGLSEQAAYTKLRQTAMNKSLKLAEVAQRMLDAAELLG
jgi:response regulator NasT